MRASPTVTGIAAAVVSVLLAADSHATKVVINKPAVEPRAGEAVVHSQVDTARLIALGARILADYPTFVLAEVADEVAPKFEEQARAEGFATFVRETFDQIRVNGYVFKAKGGEPELPADLTISDYKGPVGLYLVQMIGPVRPEWVAAIKGLAEPIHYLPDNTYIVRANPSKLAALRGQQFLQHAGVYQPAYKLRRDVVEAAQPFQAIVQLDGGQDLRSVLAILRGFARGEVVIEPAGPIRNASLVLTRDEARVLAALPEVLWIERNMDIRPSDERQALTVAGSHDGTKPINPATYKNWLEGKGFCTSTKRTGCWDYWSKVAVFDTGLDDNWCSSSPSTGGDCIASDNPTAPDRHPDLKKHDGTTREKYFYCAGPASGDNYCKGYDGAGTRWNYSDTYYHGTAVASVIAGDPLVPGGVGSQGRDRIASGDPLYSGFYLGYGVAPLAEIIGFRIFSNIGGSFVGGSTPDCYYTPTDWERWYGQLPAYPTTRFANNSWNMYDMGSNTTYDIYYTAHSQKFDQLVRDANGGFNDYSHPMTIVFSAGNSNSMNPGNYVMSPANAKNVITAGASESWRTWDIAPWNNLGVYCHPAADIKNVPQFSLRTLYGDSNRIKPDLVAGGTRIGAAFTRAPLYGNAVRPCFDDPEPGDENGRYYVRAGGTSFSAPVVTGAAVLADAWYYNKNGSVLPTPAMLKAMLTAHAESLAGGWDKLPNPDVQLWSPPSSAQGWGRVNLNNLFQASVAVKYFDEDHTVGGARRFTAGEGSWAVGLRRANATKDVVVALAFTDRFAAVNAMELRVNNLDVYVLNQSYIFQGNNFDPSGYTYRATGSSFPDLDNTVELIRIRPSDLVSETFTIEVVPGVNANAVPGLDGNGPNQDFALYVYNATNP